MVQRAELLPNWLRRRRFSSKAKRLIAAALQRRRTAQDLAQDRVQDRAREPALLTAATPVSAVVLPFPRR